MFRTRVPLFRLLGIPISVDTSWVIIAVLLTLTLVGAFPVVMNDLYPETAASLGLPAYWLMGVIAALTFFACIVLHELGHAVAGRAQGVSIRGITLFLFGGVAEIRDEPRSAKGELLMALAGPAVSVVLAVGFAVLTWVGHVLNWFPPIVVVLGYLALINVTVLVFNLVPAFPLDGGRVLRAIIWGSTGNLHRATWWAAVGGQVFAIVLIVLGGMQFLAGNLFGGLWTCLIGFFLRDAARGSYEQLLIKEALRGETVRQFMTPDPIVVSPTIDLRTWVEEYVYRHHRKAFPVISAGRLEGLIDTDVLAEVPRSKWDSFTVGEVMRRDLSDICIRPETDALDALDQMQRNESSRLLVTEDERLVGILSLRDLLSFLSLKLELESDDNDNSHSSLPLQSGKKKEPLIHA